jgi:sigma-B regulation protein RsbU (phosphoserine phosphatase)
METRGNDRALPSTGIHPEALLAGILSGSITGGVLPPPPANVPLVRPPLESGTPPEPSVRSKLPVLDSDPELTLARDIQSAILPTELPCIPGYQLSAMCRSAMEVGGDFYDAVSCRSGASYLAIADVMGCGMQAALFASKLRALFRAVAEGAPSPAELLAQINEVMFDELSTVDTFATFQVLRVEADAAQITLANAGHCPLLVAAAGHGAMPMSAEGMPIGILRESTYSEETLDLSGVTGVLMYTDGVLEASDPHGNRFGSERLRTWLDLSLGQPNSQSLAARLLAAIHSFEGSRAASDDQTVLALTPL